MRSASCFTDLRRTVAYAKNRKVQYPGGVAKNWETLQAALPCNPNFEIENYVIPACNGPTSCPPPPPPVQPIDLVYTLQDSLVAPTDPGAGYTTYTEIDETTYIFRISNITQNTDNASTLLGNMLLGTIFTISKTDNPGVSFQARLSAKTNQTTYWEYVLLLLSPIPGSIIFGDVITFTYI